MTNSRQWQAITGERSPNRPPTAPHYADAGLPWFDYYRELDAVETTDKLGGVSSVAALGANKGDTPLPENEAIAVDHVVALGSARPARMSRQVREMP